MPKSKRNKIVHLTQVKKKGKDHKEDLMKQLEEYVAKFERVYIFDFEQTKSDRIMNLRLKLKDIGRIFSGKNSLVSLTLKTIGSRTNTDFEELSKQVAGHRGLLFTDIECPKLLALLDGEVPEFCKKLLGYAQIAPDTIEMDLDDDDDDENDSTATTTTTGDSAMKKKKKKLKLLKKKRNKSKGDGKREVKFVKI